VTAAAIGVTGTVVVGVTGYWASVKNTSKTTELTRTALELTRRTVELTEQGQVTDRYTKAIDQLSSREIDMRIGGIYALERIARDSERDHPTVMEVLTAFVRDHSPEQWPVPDVHVVGVRPPRRQMRPDIQAAITVIGRRTIRYDSQPINLIDAHLGGAHLGGANLDGADLTRADLTGADLTGAHLSVANLDGAHAEGAALIGAHLEGALLIGTHLDGAALTDADLTGADLSAADLTGAHLYDAALTDADLTSAHLSGANFFGADLTGAIWPRDAAIPEGWQLDSGTLTKVSTNPSGASTDPDPSV
jgi:hypothetical protein